MKGEYGSNRIIKPYSSPCKSIERYPSFLPFCLQIDFSSVLKSLHRNLYLMSYCKSKQKEESKSHAKYP